MTTADKTGFTCGDILLLPYFSETVVLAGANGLNRPITRVNVLEVPDVIDWVRPGEFLITTGFPFRDDPDAIAEMIPKLYEKGVSALGIKTKRFIDRIPEMALEIAERMDFPVFQLPPSTVFSDVVRAIMERILVKEARELSLLQSRFQKLSQLLLYGGGIGELLGAMDEMLNNPVILLDSRDQVVLSPRAEQIVGLSRDSAIWPHLRNEINLGVSFITLEDRRIRAQISSFSDKNRNENLLILLEWDQETSVLDQLTIERVGVLVGLEMINANARKEVESKYIDQFLQDWISGRFVTLEDLNIRAKACGCPIHDGYCHYVGLIRWHGSRMTVQTQQQMVERLRSTFFRKDIQFTILEGELALLVSLPANKSMSEALERALTDLRRWFPGDNPYSICMGNGVVRPERAGESYSRAKKIHYVSSICEFRDPVIDDRHLGVFRLLYMLPENEEVAEFRDRYVMPLLEYDQKHNTLLYDTIRMYFKHSRNIKKTAAEMFAHYNTSHTGWRRLTTSCRSIPIMAIRYFNFNWRSSLTK